MYIAHRWLDRNLTRAELVFALLMISLLIATFSRYMIGTFSQAEQSMVSRTVNNINTALNYRVSIAIMRNQSEKLDEILDMNPMEDMRSKIEIDEFGKDINIINTVFANEIINAPINYAGEIVYEGSILEKGKWYFDIKTKELIYTINNDEFFDTELEGIPRAVYKIQLDFKDNDGNKQFNHDIDSLIDMKLKSVNQYTWN